MWELDHRGSWAPKNWCFWTMGLEKTFESLLDYKELKPVNPKGNQSWIFIGRTDAEKLQYFGRQMWRTDLSDKTLMQGNIEGRRRRGWQRFRGFDGITDSMDVSLSNLWEMVKDKEAWRAPVHGVTKNWTQMSNWTTITTTTSSFGGRKKRMTVGSQ